MSDNDKKPSWVASIYPLLANKSGFTRYFYYPPENDKIALYIAANMLREVTERSGDKHTLIVSYLGDKANYLEDIPHSKPLRYSCSFSFSEMTPRQIIQQCMEELEERQLNNKTERPSDNNEELFSISTNSSMMTEDEDNWKDLVDKACLSWSDESPQQMAQRGNLGSHFAKLLQSRE